MTHFGRTQLAIMRSTVGRWWRASTVTQQRSALKLHGRGFLARNPNDSQSFTATDEGTRAIQDHDAELALGRHSR